MIKFLFIICGGVFGGTLAYFHSPLTFQFWAIFITAFLWMFTGLISTD